MKLIIDIDEEIYEYSKKECDENDSLIIDNFTLAIGNGIPLEELKKDIEEIDIKEDVYKLPDLKYCGKRDKSAEEIKKQILERIDKYIKEVL